MQMPAEEEYYALMGRRGPSEGQFLSELLDTPGFKFMPDQAEPTVKITDFFCVNAAGHRASFDDVLDEDVFLHGTVLSWDGNGTRFLIGGIRIRFW